jgi:hypothetical protein
MAHEISRLLSAVRERARILARHSDEATASAHRQLEREATRHDETAVRHERRAATLEAHGAQRAAAGERRDATAHREAANAARQPRVTATRSAATR